MEKSFIDTTNHDIIEISRLLSFILDLKDPYTADHSKVVRTLSVYMGRRMGFSESILMNLNIGGYLHDIGKISIPDSILFKPGRLNDEEFEVIKTHTTFGAEFIDKFSSLSSFRSLVLHHHEKYNGSGYPVGLAGEAIPIEARLISVADVYHALYSRRCYKPAFDKAAIVAEFIRCRGSQFDPYLTDELLSVLSTNEFETLMIDQTIADEFEEELTNQVKNVQLLRNITLEEQLDQMIDVLRTALNIMNPPYASHCANVTHTVRIMVEKMKLPLEQQESIMRAASLHDIVRMGQRPGTPPSGNEGEHAVTGKKMLENISCFHNILPDVLYHHESFDGTGLPFGLKGNDIPLGARIIAIADLFDAVCKRPDATIGRPLTKAEAKGKLLSLAGKKLDSDLLDIFVSCKELFEETPPA